MPHFKQKGNTMKNRNRFNDKKSMLHEIGAFFFKCLTFTLFLAFVLLVVYLSTPEAHADELNLNFKIEHTSNPTLRESGYGLNAGFVELEYKNKNWIIAGALGVHSESADCPEVCFGGSMLARVAVGYSHNIFK